MSKLWGNFHFWVNYPFKFEPSFFLSFTQRTEFRTTTGYNLQFTAISGDVCQNAALLEWINAWVFSSETELTWLVLFWETCQVYVCLRIYDKQLSLPHNYGEQGFSSNTTALSTRCARTQIWPTDSAKIKTAAFQIDGQISDLISASVSFLPRQHFHWFAADQNGAQYHFTKKWRASSKNT